MGDAAAPPPPGTRPPIDPLIVSIAGILAISTGSILVRNAQAHAPSLVAAAYRLLISTAILAPIALVRYRHELRALSARDYLLGALSGGFLALHFWTWFVSLEHTTVASSVVLVCTTPLFVALTAPFVLGERITRTMAIGIAITVCGTTVIALGDAREASDGARALLGNALALTGAAMAAGYLLIGRRLRAKTSLVTYVLVTYGSAGVVLAVAATASGLAWTGYAPEAWLWFALLALLPQLIGHSSFNWALRYLPTAAVSVLMLGEPVGATILALFLLGEVPSLVKIAGAALILAGIWRVAKAGS